MATSATVIQTTRPTLKIWDIIFDADIDLTLVLPHLFVGVPLVFHLTPLLPAWYLNSLHVSAIDATNITLTGLNVVGSGNAAAQARLVVQTPHSII